MSADGLDAWQRTLLCRIYQGEMSFQPPTDQRDEGACRDYNFLVEALITLKNRGYIDTLSAMKSHMGGPCRYLVALARGLTYDGEKIARSLDPAPAAPEMSQLLGAEGLHQCQRDFERAVGSIAADPEQAIASASSLLESVCKAILEQAGRELPNNESMQPLMKATLDALELAPGSEAEPDIRGALKGLASIAQGIGALRTKAGAAHGRGPGHAPLEPRHARLAVNAASTVGLFLLEAALAPKG